MSTSVPGERTRTPTVFEQQREELVREIAVGMEEVLQNINRLNRNLEGIIADLLNTERRDILISYLKVGNEFSSVEALWSQFENFMGRDGEEGAGEGHAEGEAQDDHDQHEDSRVEESGRGSATDIKDER